MNFQLRETLNGAKPGNYVLTVLNVFSCTIHQKNSKTTFDPKYKICNQEIKQEKTAKDLGIIISDNLKSHHHIDMVIKKNKCRNQQN